MDKNTKPAASLSAPTSQTEQAKLSLRTHLKLFVMFTHDVSNDDKSSYALIDDYIERYGNAAAALVSQPAPAEYWKKRCLAAEAILGEYKTTSTEDDIKRWGKLVESESVASQPAVQIEQEFKELYHYFDALSQPQKDAGHTWIAFLDKFRHFEKRVLSLLSSQPAEGEQVVGVYLPESASIHGVMPASTYDFADNPKPAEGEAAPQDWKDAVKKADTDLWLARYAVDGRNAHVPDFDDGANWERQTYTLPLQSQLKEAQAEIDMLKFQKKVVRGNSNYWEQENNKKVKELHDLSAQLQEAQAENARLRQDLRDMEAAPQDWSNITRTEIIEQANQSLEKSILSLKSQLQAAQAENEALKAWKAEAIEVMPDFHEIGKLIGAKLGSSVSKQIIPFIKEQAATIAELQKQVQEKDGLLRSCYQVASRDGATTNWDALRVKLKEELEKQHTTQQFRKMGMGTLRNLLNQFDGHEISMSKFLEEINNYFNPSEQQLKEAKG
jgi:hypothetical protein